MKSENIFCVVGLGRSGYAAAQLLKRKGFRVKVTESSNSRELKKKASSLLEFDIDVELGAHNEDFYRDAALYILSPSIDNSNPVLKYAKSHNISAISEIELAWMYSPAKVIAITGTNGKTSVSTYIHRVLNKMGYSAVLAGNVGIPFSSLVLDLNKNDLVVLELSSFQLEYTVNFHPYIAVLLNISQDHLDRHKSMDDYSGAKFKIFSNQSPGDIAIVDLSQRMIKEREDSILAKLVDISVFKSPEMSQNQKAVYLIAKALGLEDRRLLSEIKKLKNLNHREESLGYIAGVSFINDSKATNPDATKWALSNIDSDVVLIAGGRDKDIDFRIIKDEISSKVKALILIGETKEKIANTIGVFVEVVKFADNLKDAVNISLEEASSGDTVLLSPMCSSFDMFKSYIERGNLFKRIVRDLQRCKN
ncbi:MAG: UDP-N-acetylmuramoyl-L-alanine--D-glutamate ligase [Candidatus Kaelpia imicola]|nr:UDP-N-acetylmuramoyl-L-alanine--D-glutamate ligase [Candidatus Kaelpia imicola]